MIDAEEVLVEPVAPPSDAELTRVAALAARQRAEEREVIRLTAGLRAALAALRLTREEELPEAMRAVGLSRFDMVDGTAVRVEDRFYGRKLAGPEGLGWVERAGGASLIRAIVTVETDREDVGVAREIYAMLAAHRAANRFKRLTLEESVHQSTIAAFARELAEAGRDPPLELLGVTRRATAIVGDRPRSVELTGLTEG